MYVTTGEDNPFACAISLTEPGPRKSNMEAVLLISLGLNLMAFVCEGSWRTEDTLKGVGYRLV